MENKITVTVRRSGRLEVQIVGKQHFPVQMGNKDGKSQHSASPSSWVSVLSFTGTLSKALHFVSSSSCLKAQGREHGIGECPDPKASEEISVLVVPAAHLASSLRLEKAEFPALG